MTSTTSPTGSRRPFLRPWALWAAGSLAFPLAGLAGTAVAGRVDDPAAALVGGTVTGLVIGVGQTLTGRRLPAPRWIPATAAGTGLGLLAGATVVGYRTTLPDLALMGALTGLVLGPVQALALPRGTRHRWAWAAAVPILWALGWTVTSLAGVDVDEQYTVFGATGALACCGLSGLLLLRLLPDPRPGSAGVGGPGVIPDPENRGRTGPFPDVPRPSFPTGFSPRAGRRASTAPGPLPSPPTTATEHTS